MAFAALEIVTADKLNRATEKVVARARRATTSSASTGSEVSVMRIDDIPLYGGYAYMVQLSSINADSTVNNDAAHIRVRYTTDGSTPSTSSSVLGSYRLTIDDATFSPILPGQWCYFPGSDETLSLLLTVQRVAGTGSVTIFADVDYPVDLLIWNLGPDPGDTGVDL